MTPIHYLKGDATAPQAKGPKILAHVCNSIGGWGSGFVLAVSKRWSEPEKSYRKWYRTGSDFGLGVVQFVQVKPDLWVANMIGQEGVGWGSKGPPIRYKALEECLVKVAEKAKELGASVHAPRIGCALAGGRWSLVEPIIKSTLCDKGIPVHIYDFGPFNE